MGVPTSEVRPAPLNLFPAMGNIREVHEWAAAQLPIVNRNQLFAVLATYHNTLLAQIRTQAY